jgi:hypothetical protein
MGPGGPGMGGGGPGGPWMGGGGPGIGPGMGPGGPGMGGGGPGGPWMGGGGPGMGPGGPGMGGGGPGMRGGGPGMGPGGRGGGGGPEIGMVQIFFFLFFIFFNYFFLFVLIPHYSLSQQLPHQHLLMIWKKESLYIYNFIIININRFSQEDIEKIKSGKCPYCDSLIIQQEERYKCANFMCGRDIAFEDVITSMKHPAKSSQQESSLGQLVYVGGCNIFQNLHPTPPMYDNTPSSPYLSFPPLSSSLTTPSNKPTIEHRKMDEDIKYIGIYKPKFLLPDGKPTNAEQNAFNKLSDKDKALEYLLYYFYFILFSDTLRKLWKKINVLNATLT